MPYTHTHRRALALFPHPHWLFRHHWLSLSLRRSFRFQVKCQKWCNNMIRCVGYEHGYYRPRCGDLKPIGDSSCEPGQFFCKVMLDDGIIIGEKDSEDPVLFWHSGDAIAFVGDTPIPISAKHCGFPEYVFKSVKLPPFEGVGESDRGHPAIGKVCAHYYVA